MSSDHFDAADYQVGRQKVLSEHIKNLANGTGAGFKRMPQPRTDTGAVNAYVITIDDFITPYEGYVVIFKPTNTNTGASTIDISGSGAVPITLDDGSALAGGELVTNHYSMLVYNSGVYERISSFILPGTVGTSGIADGSVTTIKIADLAVTDAKLASDSVTETKILDAAVTSEKVDAQGTKTDGYVWAWNASASKMEWIAQGAGADSGQVRLVDAASAMEYLGDILGDGVQVTSGTLEATGQIRVVDNSSPTSYIGDVIGPGLNVNSGVLEAHSNPNLFINPEGTVDQVGDTSGSPSSGTVVLSGSYGIDGFKSFVDGSILTVDGVGSFAISGTGAIFGQYNDDLALRDGESVIISCTTGTVEVVVGAGAVATTVTPSTPYTFTLSMASAADFVKLGEGTDCTGLKIEAGDVQTPFVRRPIVEEEMLCYSHLYSVPLPYLGSPDLLPPIGVGYVRVTTETIIQIELPTIMRKVPVVVFAGLEVVNAAGSGAVSGINLTVGRDGSNSTSVILEVVHADIAAAVAFDLSVARGDGISSMSFMLDARP